MSSSEWQGSGEGSLEWADRLEWAEYLDRVHWDNLDELAAIIVAGLPGR